MTPGGTGAGPGAAPEPVNLARELFTLDASDAVGAAWEALRGVYDPELGLDVVALGLVYDVQPEAGTVVVEMTLTTPGCPVSDSLPEQARAAIIDATDGAVGVDVQVVWDPPWSPAMMDDAAASALGFGRR